MSTAIFLTPRGNGGGYHVELGDDHTRPVEGHANLVVFDNHGASRYATLSEGDWGTCSTASNGYSTRPATDRRTTWPTSR